MPRYIDADRLMGVIESVPFPESLTVGVVRTAVDLAPTADVVEVVRCKDCKYREGSVCDYSSVYVRPNGYCQWGEKDE